jgi:hypothetical protein
MRKFLGTRPLKRPIRGWEGNTEMNLRYGVMIWMELAQDRIHWRVLVLALFKAWLLLSVLVM